MIHTDSHNIDIICNYYKISNYTINPDGSIDVDGDVNLFQKKLDKLPLKFRNVYGDFHCGVNSLTSLEGAPVYVERSFSCINNHLKTLKGAPLKVGLDFWCNHNPQLESLEFSPLEVGGDFTCAKTGITTLMGITQNIGGDLDCSHCEITSLLGAPPIIKGHFSCSGNKLVDLQYCPEIIEKNLNITHTQINTLFYFPEKCGLKMMHFTHINGYFINHVSHIPNEENDIMFKYMKYYNVWEPEFNLENFKGLIEDIKQGLL